MREALEHGDWRIPAGARLMVDGLPGDDIHRLGELAAPTTLTFFDSLGNHGLTFVTPLFDIVGFSIECICLDVMHVLDLGVSQYLVGSVFRRLIEGNVAGCAHPHTEYRRLQNLKWLRRRLVAFYGGRERARGRGPIFGTVTAHHNPPHPNHLPPALTHLYTLADH